MSMLMCIACRAQTIPQLESDTGSFMLKHCKGYLAEALYSDPNGAKCFGALSALGYVSQALIPRLRSCPPSAATKEQLGRVVIKFLEDHPEDLHLDFRFLALAAMKKVWPCSDPR
jgi:hypothetical protein